jgi:parvulin-like peptidyl-prolyl isomerase
MFCMSIVNTQDLLHQIKVTGKIPELLHGIFQQRVLEVAAQELKLEISEEEIQKGADQFRVANRLETVPATQKWLDDRMLSMEDFEQLITTNLLAPKIAQKMFFDQSAPYFYQHVLDYASAVIYEIVVTDENLAFELFHAIQEGDMTFGEAAKAYGQDLESQRRGGYVGTVMRQSMSPEVSAAVFAAESSEVLEPIVVGSQVHLILAEEVIKPALTPELQEQIMWQLFQGWLQEQIAVHRSELEFIR